MDGTSKPAAVSPEREVLLCCATSELDADRSARLHALLQRGVDWDTLLSTATAHGMLGLVAWHLTGTHAGAVPGAALDRLRAARFAIAQRNLAMTGELCRMLRLLEATGIVAIPYKGPCLAMQVYGNLALRQFVDLDVLVRPEDVAKARRLFEAEGYRPTLRLTPGQEKRFLRSGYVYTFAHDDRNVCWELHWDLANPSFAFPLEPMRVWDRLTWTTIGGVRVPMPSWEDLLVLLCVHGTKHCWERMIWLCDVAELLRVAPHMDQVGTLDRARRLGGLRMTLLGLSLASELMGAVLHENVRRQVEADASLPSLSAGVRTRLLARRPTPFSSAGLARYHLRTRERLRDRVRFGVRFLTFPTEVDWTAMRLSGTLSGLYWILRPFRLAGKYGWKFVRGRRASGEDRPR